MKLVRGYQQRGGGVASDSGRNEKIRIGEEQEREKGGFRHPSPRRSASVSHSFFFCVFL